MVLWGAVVMAIIAAAVARQATTSAVVVNASAELTRARALADGGVRAGWTAFADGQINTLDVSWACTSGEDTLLVRLRPETARIDINVATPELLAALFEAAGASRDAARRMAEATVAYRTHGEMSDDGVIVEDLSQPAEDSGPLPAGAMRPGPFQTIEELGYLPGMDPGLFRVIADDVTVHSRSLDIDRRHASALVRRAMDAALATGADTVVEADGQAALRFEGSLMNVRAIALTRSGAVFVRDAVVEGPIDVMGLPRVLRFVQGRLAIDETLPAIAQAPSCAQGFAAVR